MVAEQRTDLDACRALYDLYLHSMRRNRAMPKYSWAWVDAIRRHLCPIGAARVFLARLDGEAIAGLLVVDSASTRHYLVGGFRSDTLRHGPNDFLLAEALKDAFGIGLERFDFLPSGPGDLALDRFKRKWGAMRCLTGRWT